MFKLFSLFSLFSLISTLVCLANAEPLYLMVLGGYNVANSGEPLNWNNSHNSPNTSAVKYLYAPHTDTSQYYWTRPTDTLIGVPGNGTSYWNYLAHLIHNHTNQEVNLMVHSLPNGNINNWQKDQWMETVHHYLFGNQTDVNVTVLWIEGENDSESYFWWRKGYKSLWKNLYTRSRKLGNYTWGLGVSTYSPYNYDFDEESIRNELNYILKNAKNNTIFGGAKSDTLCQSYRYNYQFFNHYGQKQLVWAWNQSLFNRSNQFVNANPNSNSYCSMRIFSVLTATIILAEMLLPILAIALCCFCLFGGFYYYRRRTQVNVYYTHLSQDDSLPKYTDEKEPLLN